MMKPLIAIAATALTVFALPASAHTDWSVNIGVPMAGPVYAPPPVYAAPPVVYSAPQVVYSAPPVDYPSYQAYPAYPVANYPAPVIVGGYYYYAGRYWSPREWHERREWREEHGRDRGEWHGGRGR